MFLISYLSSSHLVLSLQTDINSVHSFSSECPCGQRWDDRKKWFREKWTWGSLNLPSEQSLIKNAGNYYSWSSKECGCAPTKKGTSISSKQCGKEPIKLKCVFFPRVGLCPPWYLRIFASFLGWLSLWPILFSQTNKSTNIGDRNGHIEKDEWLYAPVWLVSVLKVLLCRRYSTHIKTNIWVTEYGQWSEMKCWSWDGVMGPPQPSKLGVSMVFSMVVYDLK